MLQGLLGEVDQGGYAVSAPDGFLVAGREHVHPTEIARLPGARLDGWFSPGSASQNRR